MTKKYYKPIITCPKIEDIKLKTDYAITINKASSIITCLQDDVRNYMKWVNKHIRPYCKDYELIFELSKCGKLHLHGVIQFSNDTSLFYFYHNLNKEINASVHIKEIKDTNIWVKYYTKQLRFRPIYEALRIPYILKP